MYKIIIIDDELQSRRNNQSSLILTFNNQSWEENRRNFAIRHFEITNFAIAGAAIQYLATQPSKRELADLILLDISFAQLHDVDVIEKGFDAKIETSETRGFEVYDFIKEEVQTILFTAYDHRIETIAEEIAKRENLKYTSMLPKAAGINRFANVIRENLEIVANQLIANANERNFAQFENLLYQENPNINQIIYAEMHLDGRVFTLQNFFIYKFRLDEKGQSLVPDASFLDYVRAFFSGYLRSEEIEVKNIEMPQFNGFWQHDWVQQLILDFRESNTFQDKNNQINRSAANGILEFLQANHQNNYTIQGHCANVLSKANIGQNPFEYGNNANTAKFLNALISRRLFLGLNQLADNPIWAMGINRRLVPLLEFIMEKSGWTVNDNNIRNRFTVVLGLSIRENHIENQRLNGTNEYLLQEEADFLQNYIPQILAKIQRQEGHQPNPNYTPFA